MWLGSSGVATFCGKGGGAAEFRMLPSSRRHLLPPLFGGGGLCVPFVALSPDLKSITATAPKARSFVACASRCVGVVSGDHFGDHPAVSTIATPGVPTAEAGSATRLGGTTRRGAFLPLGRLWTSDFLECARLVADLVCASCERGKMSDLGHRQNGRGRQGKRDCLRSGIHATSSPFAPWWDSGRRGGL